MAAQWNSKCCDKVSQSSSKNEIISWYLFATLTIFIQIVFKGRVFPTKIVFKYRFQYRIGILKGLVIFYVKDTAGLEQNLRQKQLGIDPVSLIQTR